MKKPNVLILADKNDIKYLDSQRQSEHWNITWKVIDFSRWQRNIAELKALIEKNDIDFVMYSRNDQVSNRVAIGTITRTLETGYSSFDGIDKADRISQMSASFDDFMECRRSFNYSVGQKRRSARADNDGTFSLIFDSEQLGGVKYGMPRILDLLNGYGIDATFFITNLVKKVYPDILEVIKKQGHEVGIHGLWHEYLSGSSREKQANELRSMQEDFNTGITGANLMGRMDESTIHAMVDSKLKYFVYALKDSYGFVSYRRISTLPSLISQPAGNIWALPVSLETYNAPWFSIKNMIDSAIEQSQRCGFRHISILCHDFRDGNLQHIRVTEKLLDYMKKKNQQSLTLDDLVNKLDTRRSEFPLNSEIKKFVQQEKGRASFPISRLDFLGMIPENLVTSYRLFRKNRGTF